MVRGQLSSGAPEGVAESDAGQQFAGLGRRQELLGGARHQLQQQRAQPLDGVRKCRAELVTTVGQETQRDEGGVDGGLVCRDVEAGKRRESSDDLAGTVTSGAVRRAASRAARPLLQRPGRLVANQVPGFLPPSCPLMR